MTANTRTSHGVYIPFTNKKGRVNLSGVRMLNICFVKFDGVDKEYSFYNPSNILLKAGTMVLVDARGVETKATVTRSIYVKKFGFPYLKNVLGMYSKKIIMR